MKIIDILNKKANGELEDGFKFKFGEIYTYNKNTDSIKDEKGEAIGNFYCIEKILDYEVDIIEENKEIEELNKISYDEFKYTDNKHRFDLTNIEYDKINELIRAVNKLIKEREEM